ncbi:mucin-4-like [Pyxicephalus adspersus]|uniref:mucin-4-like n=1 Tax=Pyxicephalus adspersus TaxID=30357 RepID=UPI003B595F30
MTLLPVHEQLVISPCSPDTYSQYYTYQTAFSTWFGGGTRCYYTYRGSLNYGEKERYLPTPWQYSWNQMQTIRNQYQANEVDPYHNCCIYSGSSYLCSLYRNRRPYDFCSGYIPPRPGSMIGDPHISTLDDVQYTFNGLGEFTLDNVRDENNTLIFTLQGRTDRAGNGTQATKFIGLVAKFQNQTRVEWLLQDSNTTIVRINGTMLALSGFSFK